MTIPFPVVDPALDARLKSLPRDIPPPRDLWPGIAAVVGPSAAAPTAITARRVSRRRPYAMAAGIAIAALVGLVGWQAARGLHPASAAARVAPIDVPESQKYRETRALLEATYRERVALLAPVTRLRIERDLRIVRRAIADIRHALASDPDSRVLAELLASTSQQELDLDAAVARGTAQLPSRNSI